MSPRFATLVLVLLSIVYGLGVAILGVLDSPAVTTVAVTGGIVLGALWVLRGLIFSRDRPAG